MRCGPRSAAEQAIIAFSQSNLLQEQPGQPADKDSIGQRGKGSPHDATKSCRCSFPVEDFQDKKKKKTTKLTPEEHALRKARISHQE
eukprot:Skav232236  [mRNA]  locus=scaffold273:22932:23435:- [translate_table: standard]